VVVLLELSEDLVISTVPLTCGLFIMSLFADC
jgi:hypothetical protein